MLPDSLLRRVMPRTVLNRGSPEFSVGAAHKLADVGYDIRGPIYEQALRLEAEGHDILKLNIGNPAIFGFDTPPEILAKLIENLPNAQGYCEPKGVVSARQAVIAYYASRGLQGLHLDNVLIGNGVSELVGIALQGFLNSGDEMLVPAPDFPLWTDTVSLNGARPVHYLCDESAGWQPDFDDLVAKITPRTRALVVINPNNPTGAVYRQDTLQQFADIASKHNLVLFADEIYERIVFDGERHIPLASLATDQLVVTFGGLSKAYRAAGLRVGWMALSGPTQRAKSYINGLALLAAMRLCANVPGQYAIAAALEGYQSIDDLIAPGGRLAAQRDFVSERVNQIEGVSCVQPKGALYAFVRLDPKRHPIEDDERMVLEFLRTEKVLLAHGTAFHWPTPDHARLIFLPSVEDLERALSRFERFLGIHPEHGRKSASRRSVPSM